MAKLKLLLTLLIFSFITSASYAGPKDPLPDYLQKISVTIKSEGRFSSSEGSGVIITRTIEGKQVNFVWTAAHVLDNLRTTKVKIIAGKKTTVVEFKPVSVVKELYQNDSLVGELKMRAEVIKYSDSEEGHDLALLRILKTNFIKSSAKFHLGIETPSLGTELYHVGSLHGQFGSNSLTTGIISSLGRKLRGLKEIFDQTTVTALPGSSGGGVYLKSDGSYIGMLVRGVRGSDGFNFIVPIRRMITWSKESKIYWALDPKAPTPSFKDLKKIPVEGSSSLLERKASSTYNFPFLIKKTPKKTPY